MRRGGRRKEKPGRVSRLGTGMRLSRCPTSLPAMLRFVSAPVLAALALFAGPSSTAAQTADQSAAHDSAAHDSVAVTRTIQTVYATAAGADGRSVRTCAFTLVASHADVLGRADARRYRYPDGGAHVASYGLPAAATLPAGHVGFASWHVEGRDGGAPADGCDARLAAFRTAVDALGPWVAHYAPADAVPGSAAFTAARLATLPYEKEDEEGDVDERRAEVGLRSEFERRRLADPRTGAVPEGIRVRELAFAERAAVAGKNGGAQIDTWTPRGPVNVGGRTRALAIDLGYNGTTNRRILAGGISGASSSPTTTGPRGASPRHSRSSRA